MAWKYLKIQLLNKKNHVLVNCLCYQTLIPEFIKSGEGKFLFYIIH